MRAIEEVQPDEAAILLANLMRLSQTAAVVRDSPPIAATLPAPRGPPRLAAHPPRLVPRGSPRPPTLPPTPHHLPPPHPPDASPRGGAPSEKTNFLRAARCPVRGVAGHSERNCI